MRYPMEPIFEVKYKDMMGRIGLLRTSRHELETPTLLPVVNPSKLIISAKELYEEFGVQALITNAYLVRKFLYREAIKSGIHGLLKYKGLIVTDSGAYQILKYGGIDAKQREIVEFQEAIHTDVGIILDIPTGSELDENRARFTVEETIRRADEAVRLRRSDDIIWMGPVQGGTHLDLLGYSAREMSKRPYPILALGSPTVIMERYQYEALVDMIATTKMNIPPSRPLHLFGAGHPSMMSFAVALGCDLFDSAAYALFAYEGRYMTEDGTLKLQDMEYLPCSCPVCSKNTANELRRLEPGERARRIARHNLWTSLSEVKRIKQAIQEGRLWELLERRSRAHPALQDALLALGRHNEYIERHSPSDKPHGILYFGRSSIVRPEIMRFRRRLRKCFGSCVGLRSIMFITYPWGRLPKRLSKKANITLRKYNDRYVGKISETVFVPSLGPIPTELLEAYPAGKIMMPSDLDVETLDDTIRFSRDILRRKGHVLVIADGSTQAKGILERSRWLRMMMVMHPYKKTEEQRLNKGT